MGTVNTPTQAGTVVAVAIEFLEPLAREVPLRRPVLSPGLMPLTRYPPELWGPQFCMSQAYLENTEPWGAVTPAAFPPPSWKAECQEGAPRRGCCEVDRLPIKPVFVQ